MKNSVRSRRWQRRARLPAGLGAILFFLALAADASLQRLNSPLAPGVPAGASQVIVTDTHVIYLIDQKAPGAFEVFVAPAQDPGSASRVATREDAAATQIAPGANHVFYRDARSRAYRAPLGEPATIELVSTSALPIKAVSDDGQKLVTGTGSEFFNRSHTLMILGDDPVSLPLGPLGFLSSSCPLSQAFRFSPSEPKLAYLADQGNDSALWIRGFDDSNAPMQLSDNQSTDVCSIEFSPDGQNLAYLARTTTGAAVFTVAADGSGIPRRLTPATGHTAVGSHIFPLDDRIFYSGNYEVAVEQQLYSAPFDGSEAPLRLLPALNFRALFPELARGEILAFANDELLAESYLFRADAQSLGTLVNETPHGLPLTS
ncbi:MAG: hypothetical protein AAGA95_21525, partial [Pseudomonadota bacterium]